ncbi:gliding motility-associated ABC transporter ATP-binding subunit GldA [Marinigracilibium pacificum]|uniref:Gliding motility-associated ABC transporter ATP-binding subunit GldA n=1 Tax=Marinigracilibium pacificum TaxID=2729599 RepID=A0A848IZX3_9BACT|nr:gliding motility-associated ABC transporter ATP-binding subunit GldA [Marinigracilibium pacificum]NMM50093.1 gliding motility-associated ABC transporter ATP-binding subunit GldA [Marinigracilibium pacificum]
MSITVNNISKKFGNQLAVNNLSFEVSKGEILGFLGPNGAGKSTTMKILAGYIPPSEGNATVCGFDVEKEALSVQKNIGYLPEHNPMYLDMYVHEFLKFCGKLQGLRGSSLNSRVKDMVELCGLSREQNKQIVTLSKGYRQRVGLAKALLHDPEVLILDEPTSGLDPNQILEIRSVIKEASRDKAVIFSTHIMQEVQALCDRVVVINLGSKVADKPVEGLGQELFKEKVVIIEFLEDASEEIFLNIEGVKSVKKVTGKKFLISSAEEKDIRPVLSSFAAGNNLTIVGLQQEERTLEEVFHKLTGGGK